MFDFVGVGASVRFTPGRACATAFRCALSALTEACDLLAWNWLDRLGCRFDPKLGSEQRNSVIKTTYLFIRFSFSKSEMVQPVLLLIAPHARTQAALATCSIIGQSCAGALALKYISE